jgi:hypothetical protein
MGPLGQAQTSAQIQALEDYKRASEMVDYQRTGEDLDYMALKCKNAAKTAQRDLAAAAAQVKGKAKPIERPTVATITTAIPVKNVSMATTSGSSTTHGKETTPSYSLFYPLFTLFNALQ